MRTRGLAVLVHLLASLVLVAFPAVAQYPPDCTGISDVSRFDGDAVSDMNGLLTTVRLTPYQSLQFPINLVAPPGDLERLFIIEQRGRIRILKGKTIEPTPFLDIETDVICCYNEEGLLGIAFDPDYQTNGYFYIYYTNLDGNNVLERWSVDPTDPDLADPASRTVVMTILHELTQSHNGGTLAFSPLDDHLYIGIGDGGDSCLNGGLAADLDSLLGKILRINVDTLPYTTTGNPYDGATPGLDEIWVHGLRNPWRFSFDRIMGTMLIGDVGGLIWEEFNCLPANSTGGESFGWPYYEGPECPNPTCSGSTTCTVPDYLPPIDYFEHTMTAPPQCAAMGGTVYRGCRMTDLHGTYFYNDFCTAKTWSMRVDSTCGTTPVIERTGDLVPIGPFAINSLTAIAEDQQGEMYMVDRAGGEIFKIIPVLSIMEASGLNASPLRLGRNSWYWEDLEGSSFHPINRYKLFRSTTGPTGTFTCHRMTSSNICDGDLCTWPATAQDPQSPGDLHYFLVLGESDDAGQKSHPGYRSDDTPRSVALLSSCI